MNFPEGVRPDSCTRISVKGEEYLVSPSYDSIHYFMKQGRFVLKIFDEEGMTNFYIPEHSAWMLHEDADIPVVSRPFMFASEYDSHITAMSQELNDTWLT